MQATKLSSRLLLSLAVALSVACSSPADDSATPPGAAVLPIQPGQLGGFDHLVAIGRVWLGSQPTAEGLVNVRDAGATLVINARPSEEMSFPEESVVRGLGMEYRSLPFTAKTLDARTIDNFLDVMREHEGRVLLHCSSGNRVAALWAVWEIREGGLPVDEAIARARKAGLKSPELIGAIGDYLRAKGLPDGASLAPGSSGPSGP